MRKNLTAIVIVGFVLTILAFRPEVDKSTGSLGDVKYSILPPDKFIEQNGKGWVLMDDKVLVKGSDLQNCCGVTQIPDARGLFIRGLNLKRSDGNEDPFEKENGKERMAGEFQSDALRNHTHSCSFNMAGTCSNGNGDDGKIARGQNGCWERTASEIKVGTVNSGGSSDNETRPKNLALYVYIKINNEK